MNIELIVCIALAILLAFSTWMAGKYWKEKEHYRCRVFDLTNGKEGSNLPKAPDIQAPPKIFKPSPTRPLLTEWLHNNSGEYFRRDNVVALILNSDNCTMDVMLGNGHTISTGLDLDDLKKVLGISFSCSIFEELEYRKKMHKMEDWRMTEEELKKVPFRETCHMAMEGEYTTTYMSKDWRLGFCDHVPRDKYGMVKKGGRSVRHFMIGGKVYKSKKKFLEAIKDFNP